MAAIFPENKQQQDAQAESAYQEICYLLGKAKVIADAHGLVLYAGVYSPTQAKGTTVAETGKQMLRKVAGGLTENQAFKEAMNALIQAGVKHLESSRSKK